MSARRVPASTRTSTSCRTVRAPWWRVMLRASRRVDGMRVSLGRGADEGGGDSDARPAGPGPGRAYWGGLSYQRHACAGPRRAVVEATTRVAWRKAGHPYPTGGSSGARRVGPEGPRVAAGVTRDVLARPVVLIDQPPDDLGSGGDRTVMVGVGVLDDDVGRRRAVGQVRAAGANRPEHD